MSGLVNVKEINSLHIIKLIREKGPISRVEISDVTRIPQPTITRITEELLKDKIIQEVGYVQSARGRKPVLLTFNPKCFYSIGVQISRSRVTVAFTDLNGNIEVTRTTKFTLNENFSTVYEFITQFIREVLDTSSVDKSLLLGIGVGIPGPFNETVDGEISPPNFFNEKGIKLREMLKGDFNLPVYVDDTSNVAAVAEKWFGKGIGHDNFLYIMAETGIGLGIFINGNLYRGDCFEAGMIGHSTIDINGEKCECGNYGCLETFVSITKIEEFVKRKLKLADNYERQLYKEEIEDIVYDDIIAALYNGSELAKQVLDETGRYLGVGIANCINIINPEFVVIGGKLGTSSPVLLQAVQSTVKTQVLSLRGKKTPILQSELDNAIVLGASALVIDDTFPFYSIK